MPVSYKKNLNLCLLLPAVLIILCEVKSIINSKGTVMRKTDNENETEREVYWHMRYVNLQRKHKVTVSCLIDAIEYVLNPTCCGDALRDKVNIWCKAVGLPAKI